MDSKLYQWPIPDMAYAAQDRFQPPPAIVKDLVEMRGLDHIDDMEDLITRISRQGHSNAPNVMAIKRGSRLALYEFQTYPAFNTPNHDPNGYAPNTSPLLFTTHHDVDPKADFASPIQPCNRGFVYPLLGSNSISARFVDAHHPSGNSGTFKPKTLHMGPLANQKINLASLCAATGRLCILTDGGELYVLDYRLGNVDHRTGSLNSWGISSGVS